MITVSKSKIIDALTGSERTYRYSDIPTDENKWVYDLNYMPIPYDLMHLKFTNIDTIKSGWWTGIIWKGLRVKKEDKVKAWKRNDDFE